MESDWNQLPKQKSLFSSQGNGLPVRMLFNSQPMKEMKKRKIIINIESDDISDQEAVMLVNSVISQGRVSHSRGKAIYCFLTEFPDDKKVFVHPNCKSDVFSVWRSKKMIYFAPRQTQKPILIREDTSR